MLKGNKPDFHNALGSDASKPMYEDFLARLQSLYKPEAVKGKLDCAVQEYHNLMLESSQ